jgi:LuxR family transcriptional regulator, maltose regulon positive regulatory protein
VPRHDPFAKLAGAEHVIHPSAPAGSGKTVLLRSWIIEARLDDRVALVSVPAGARDPQRFWISIADALRATRLGSTLVKATRPGWRWVTSCSRSATRTDCAAR